MHYNTYKIPQYGISQTTIHGREERREGGRKGEREGGKERGREENKCFFD